MDRGCLGFAGGVVHFSPHYMKLLGAVASTHDVVINHLGWRWFAFFCWGSDYETQGVFSEAQSMINIRQT